MENVFIKLLNMSINAGWLIIAVVVLRILLKNAPKYIRCVLWAMVGIRLVCPFSIESVFSLIPNTEAVNADALFFQNQAVDSAMSVPFQSSAAQISGSAAESGADPLQVLTLIASMVWAAGAAVMLTYAFISYAVLRRKVQASVKLQDDIWICDDIDSPFILGVFRPRIYVPSDTDQDQLAGITAHERAHLKRLDHWWKPLGFILLSVYWFNPLIWAAYLLLCRDIELACDERVIREMDADEKKKYSETLLACSISRRNIAACPLAFGEVGVKERIKTVLSYKKPTVWILTAAIVVCAIVSVCFLTDPVGADRQLERFISLTILEHGMTEHTEGRFACEAHDTIGVKRDGDTITVYALVMYQEFSFENGVIVSESGSHIPTAITVARTDSGYSLIEYWESDDGTRYASSIRSKFPWYLEDIAINIHRKASEHESQCIAQAEKYYGAEYVDPYANTTWTTSVHKA